MILNDLSLLDFSSARHRIHQLHSFNGIVQRTRRGRKRFATADTIYEGLVLSKKTGLVAPVDLVQLDEFRIVAAPLKAESIESVHTGEGGANGPHVKAEGSPVRTSP